MCCQCTPASVLFLELLSGPRFRVRGAGSLVQWPYYPPPAAAQLNHIWWNNFARTRNPNRPLLMHRWGGLGNHRYQIGFSGDVVPSWTSRL